MSNETHVYWCTFKNKPFLFIGSKEEKDGAIATPNQFDHFDDSYANLSGWDGMVRRFHVVIGSVDDVVIGELRK